MTQKCISCGLEKPYECFFKNNTYTLGVIKKCKECCSSELKKKVRENRVPIIPIEGEEWKDIDGFVGHFQVSNKFRIKSLERISPNGKLVKEKVLSISFDKHTKCYKVMLRANGVKKTKSVYRLVAIAFIPNPLNLPQVNHIDANRSSFALGNLEWVTASQNTKHSFNLGISCNKGDNSPRAKLNSIKVCEIRSLLSTTKLTQKQIGDQYGVHHSLVSLIKKNKIWA